MRCANSTGAVPVQGITKICHFRSGAPEIAAKPVWRLPRELPRRATGFVSDSDWEEGPHQTGH